MRSNRARFAVVMSGVLALAACSSSGASSGNAPVPTNVVAMVGGGAGSAAGGQMVVGNTAQMTTLAAPREAVWALLPSAYEYIGVPLSVKDDAQFSLGNDQVRARRVLNGVQMRSIVDCGSDLNGEKAESYDIRLSIRTTLSAGAAANTTQIGTLVSGQGRSASVSGGDVMCSTKGELERRILKYVRTQLGLPGQ